jgi:hypothetical protein
MQRLFFATAEDLRTVFDRVEARWRLAYTLTGLFETPELTTTPAGEAIPTLHSPPPHAGAIAGYQYLVTAVNDPVVVREVPQRRGGVRYAVDQLANPRSVALMPGGLYPPDIRLYGRVGTASDAEFSVRLYRTFASAICGLFLRVGAYYVGRQAEEFWRGGQRLTIGANSPLEYDLAVPEVKPGG